MRIAMNIDRAGAVAIIAIAASVFSVPAEAAEVRRVGNAITYEASPGEGNDLTVASNGTAYVFTDPGALGGAPIGSSSCPAAQCPAPDVVEIAIVLGDGDDQVRIDDAGFPAGRAPGTPRITVHGEGGADIIDGGGGDDTLWGGPDDDKIQGGEGNDLLDVNAGADVADVGDGADLLDGGPGDDQLGGGPPAGADDVDWLVGGAGVDTADYGERNAPLEIDLAEPGGDGERGEGDTVHPDVERLIGGSEGDTLHGSAADNVVEGRAGDDIISGREGNDVLSAGAGSGTDEISGGPGNDTIEGGGGEDDLRGGDDDDTVAGGGGGDELDGGSGGDTLRGGPAGDTIEGGAGNDIVEGAGPGVTGADGGDDLSGGAGMDILAGDRGDDTLDGGAGPDVIGGDAGQDRVTYEHRSGPVTVTLDGLANDGEEGEGDNVSRTVEEVIGGSVADTLTGDADGNTIRGASGEDDVNGRSGRDDLSGGDATDLIRARDGNRDVVECGDDDDIAILDPGDLARDCETKDRGGRRPLRAGGTALISPTRGDYRLQPPDARRFFDLSETLTVPIGSTVDATHGEVRVSTARRGGRRQTIFASGGVFSVRQRRGRRAVTELSLRGPLGRCPRPSGQRARVAQDQPGRRLRTRITKQRKRFKVAGRYSIGAARGTAWWTEDTCEGTLTRVQSGTVRVEDLELRKTVTVKAGDTYLAKPR